MRCGTTRHLESSLRLTRCRHGLINRMSSFCKFSWKAILVSSPRTDARYQTCLIMDLEIARITLASDRGSCIICFIETALVATIYWGTLVQFMPQIGKWRARSMHYIDTTYLSTMRAIRITSSYQFGETTSAEKIAYDLPYISTVWWATSMITHFSIGEPRAVQPSEIRHISGQFVNWLKREDIASAALPTAISGLPQRVASNLILP